MCIRDSPYPGSTENAVALGLAQNVLAPDHAPHLSIHTFHTNVTADSIPRFSPFAREIWKKTAKRPTGILNRIPSGGQQKIESFSVQQPIAAGRFFYAARACALNGCLCGIGMLPP